MSATSAPDTAAIEYLTVQDVLWINLQVTKQTNPFDYAKLEEATFYQYGYGGSRDVLAQAARFLKGFLAQAPFGGRGDAMTALVGTAAFLAMNGFHLDVPSHEAEAWVKRVANGEIDVNAAIAQLAHPVEGHRPSAIEAMREALTTYGF